MSNDTHTSHVVRFASGILLLGALSACGGQQTKTSTADPEATKAEAPKTAEKPATTPAEKPPEAAGATEIPEQKVDEAPKVRDVALAMLEEGKRSAASGDLNSARARFEEAAQSDPGFAEPLYNLAVLKEWQGDYGGARRAYEATLQVRPDFGPAVIGIANLMMRQGDSSGALRYAEAAAARDPESNGLANAVNHVRLELGNPETVITSCKQVLRRDERNVDAMKILAGAYAKQGKHELAVAILKNAKALRGDDPDIDYRMSLSHQTMGEDINTQLALERAVQQEGGAGPEAHNNLGLIYAKAGDFPGAEEQFRKAIARWPDMLPAHVNLGNALKGQQKFTEALQALKKAESLAPAEPKVLYNLGIFYLDAAVPDMDPEMRLNQSVRYLEQYMPRADGDMRTRVEGYIKEARKRIVVEQKRKEAQRNQPKTPEPPPEEPPSEESPSVESSGEAGAEGGAESAEDAGGEPAEGGGEAPTEDAPSEPSDGADGEG
ncbi:MAG: tetratricopeptide repeat protein [Bradymonadia bacterium]